MTTCVRSGALLVAVSLAVSACGFSGLSFVEDRRLDIVSPEERASVRLPVTVTWKVSDFEITGRTGTARRDAGYFGVFVDRAPPAPGRTLESLADDDRVCQATPGCPDEAYLAEHRAYATSDTQFTIEELPDPTRGDDRREFHEVTIVLLDGKGERIGESAFSVEFQVERKER